MTRMLDIYVEVDIVLCQGRYLVCSIKSEIWNLFEKKEETGLSDSMYPKQDGMDGNKVDTRLLWQNIPQTSIHVSVGVGIGFCQGRYWDQC